MRKLFITASLIAATFNFGIAQDTPIAAPSVSSSSGPILSKRGYPILPEGGDWSIGFGASNLLNYVRGSLFGADTVSTGMRWNNVQNSNVSNVITGKYFLDANTAFRARLRVGMQSSTLKDQVPAIPATTPTSFVENTTKFTSTNILLGAGLEKRKGLHRVQGIYGGEALIGFSSSGEKREYGNALSSTNPAPRTTEINNPAGFAFGVRGFIGVEYFFAPKISIGAEYGWGLLFNTSGRTETTSEAFVSNAATTTTVETGTRQTLLRLDTDINSGSINLNFYF